MAKGDALKRARKQARAEAAVRYNPQQRVLVDALASARAEEQRAVRSAKGTSSALTAAIHRARKPLRQGYADAAKTAEAARGDLFGHLLAVGEPARPFAAAVAREQAGVTSRAAQERAGALGELTLRGVQAHEGRAAAIQNAHRTFSTDAGQVYRQLVGLSQDRGTFTAGQIESIQAAQRSVAAQNKRAQLSADTSTANNIRTNRTSRANTRDRVRESRRKDAAKLGASVLAGTKKKAELQGSHKIKAQVLDARAAYERGLNAGWPGRKIAREARKQKVPEHVLVAAADLANFGYVTPGHLRALRQAGVTHIPKSWTRKRRTLPSVTAANRAGHAR